jgi:hypothetical protein
MFAFKYGVGILHCTIVNHKERERRRDKEKERERERGGRKRRGGRQGLIFLPTPKCVIIASLEFATFGTPLVLLNFVTKASFQPNIIHSE